MSNCNICKNRKSSFVMNNRSICMRCDELLLDLEIECEEDYVDAEVKRREYREEIRKRAQDLAKK